MRIQSIIRYAVWLLALSSVAVAAPTRIELPDFTPLVEAHANAVVTIQTTGRASQGTQAVPGLPEDHPMYEFFKDFLGRGRSDEGIQIPRPNTPIGRGSGFVVAEDGYIITNHHVVRNGDKITVQLSDRREFIAELIGSDKQSDIALLKIEARGLPVLQLGDSSDLKVGEWVLAIGAPFGFNYSATAGIVSAIGRSLPNENYIPFIQTDVAINQGNSGGPLFNLEGEVVGVNSQIYSPSGSFVGLSFAVPADVVKVVYRQLKENGQVSRGWLGVMIQDVTRELADSFQMEKPRGALIADVLEEGPARGAGLREGDIILQYNGKPIHTSSDLPPLVGVTQVGTRVPVDILRAGQESTLQVTVAALPDKDGLAQIRGADDSEPPLHLGMALRDLDEQQREEFKVVKHGVLVERVVAGPASRAGIRPNDVIILFNNIKVRDRAHLLSLVPELPQERPVPVLVQRQNGSLFLSLKATEEDGKG